MDCMKLISFVVCCYNSQDYMRDALDSLVQGGEEVEVIVVDDGSKDDTPKIADEYGAKYPSIIKVVHQPNGGHGAGVMAGIKLATGLYFKIVDSDDWVDQEGYKEVLSSIRQIGNKADLIVTDFEYYHGKKPVKDNTYHNFPARTLFRWEDSKRLKLVQNMLIQSVMWRTDILKNNGLDLPHHVSYDDMLFLCHNMYDTEVLYYLPVHFYCYNVGRPGQSVQADISIKHYKDFLLEAELMFKCRDPYNLIDDKERFFALYHQLRITFYTCVTYARLKNTKESKKELKETLRKCKEANPRLYKRLRYFSKGWPLLIPGFIGYVIAFFTYRSAQRLVRFN